MRGNDKKQTQPEPPSKQNKAILKSNRPPETKHATAMKIVSKLDNEMKLIIPDYLEDDSKDIRVEARKRQ